MRVNKLEKGDYIRLDGKILKVLDITHTHLGRGGANLELKLQNLNGGIIRKNFKPDDEVEYVELEKKKLIFLYSKKDKLYFSDEKKQIFEINQEILQDKAKFLKKNLEVVGYFDEENLVSIELPIKIEYEVKSAPPGVKGDTAQGGSKVVICENGLEVVVPLFIKEGDKIIVNTETGEYVSKI